MDSKSPRGMKIVLCFGKRVVFEGNRGRSRFREDIKEMVD
jgi:hypothetical protein